MTKRVLLYFALLLWFVVPVTAQPTIFVSDASVDEASSIAIDVKVSGFTEILSMQFSVNWDPAFFTFDSVSISNPSSFPNYSSGQNNFGLNSVAEGRLGTSWFDQDLLGITLADNTTAFTIHYTVLGNSEGTSEILITDNPTVIEVSNINSEILEVTTENGTVTVLEPTGIEDLHIQSNQAFSLFQNEPNPFDNQTVVRFDVYEPSDFELVVYDSKGTIIHTENAHFFEGSQSITIDSEILPVAGTYFYKLKTKDYFITNRMILVRK